MDFILELIFELFEYVTKTITDKNAPIGAKILIALLIGLPVVTIIILAVTSGA